MEDLLVVQRRERDEADERGREERQRVPDPAQRSDLPQDADRFRERRRRFVGADDVGVRARRLAFPVTASRIDQAETEEHEHEGRDREQDERHAPAEDLAEHAAERAADERAEGEPDLVRAEHVGAHFGRVEVGEQ